MQAVLLVIHVIIAIALIGIILIQRSDSDGFGLGSGSGSNFMSGRGAANFLTRTTSILATVFIINSLVLGIMAAHRSPDSISDAIERLESEQPPAVGTDAATEDASGEKAKQPETPAKPAAKDKKLKTEPSVPTE